MEYKAKTFKFFCFSFSDQQMSATSLEESKLESRNMLLRKIRASEIPLSLQHDLSLRLNIQQVLSTNNYRGLAEKIGLTPVQIRALDRESDPTDHVLQKLGGKPDGNLHTLVRYLQELEREDCTEVIDKWLDEQVAQQVNPSQHWPLCLGRIHLPEDCAHIQESVSDSGIFRIVNRFFWKVFWEKEMAKKIW